MIIHPRRCRQAVLIFFICLLFVGVGIIGRKSAVARSPVSVSFLGFTNDGGQETIVPEQYVRGLYVPPRTIHAWFAVVLFSNRSTVPLFLRGDVFCERDYSMNSAGQRIRKGMALETTDDLITARGVVIKRVPAGREAITNHWPIIAEMLVLSYRPEWHLHVANFLNRLGIDVEIGPQVEHQRISEIWNTK